MYTTPNLRRSQQCSMHLQKKVVFHRFILKKIQPRNLNIIKNILFFSGSHKGTSAELLISLMKTSFWYTTAAKAGIKYLGVFYFRILIYAILPLSGPGIRPPTELAREKSQGNAIYVLLSKGLIYYFCHSWTVPFCGLPRAVQTTVPLHSRLS